MTPLTAAGIERGRSLQTRLCRLSDDANRGHYQCTLEEYCDVLDKSNGEASITCVGDLQGRFSLITQDYVCLEPGSSWINADHRICYTHNDRTDYSQTTAVRRSFDIDFVEGLSFKYFAEAELCPDDSTRQCACAASIEGRPCTSCQVCNNGAATQSANAYLYELDCTNIADGLTRSCDPTESWGDFFELVDDIGVQPLVSQPTGTSTVLTQSPLPSPTNNRKVGEDSSKKGLSSAALGGIVGGAVGTGLAIVLAIVLTIALRRRSSDSARYGADKGNAPSNGNINAGQAGDARPNNNDREPVNAPSIPHVMADAILLDEDSPIPRETGATGSYKPDFKQQIRP